MKRMFRRLTRARAALIGVVTAAIAVAIAAAIAQPGSAVALPGSAVALPSFGSGQWPLAGQNISDTHFQAAEHVISPANVSRLTPRWTLTTAGAISATPAVDGGVVYVPDYGGKLWAVEASSGRVLWSKSISDYTGLSGDQSRVSPAVYGNDIILGDGWIVSPNEAGAKVFAVNRRTGALDWVTQVDNDPQAVITAAPTIYRGVAYFGISSKGEASLSPTFRGAVVALNGTTGKLLWKAYTVPSNNGNSDSNLANGYYTGNAVWGSSPAVDPARGLLYVGTGNNYTAPAGVCENPGQTDTAGSWAALDPATGKILWQTPDPNGSPDTAPVSVANGVVYGGSDSTTGTSMYGLDAATGAILWSFNSGGSVTGGAAIVAGSVYWGSGYCGTECFTTGNPLNNDKLYAFGLH